ncbi:hypothetical protein J6590_057859 [Homalodisca vitripennis]|nr:hypothetical protein J6590_057859 [Homalodisca vitripennis]
MTVTPSTQGLLYTYMPVNLCGRRDRKRATLQRQLAMIRILMKPPVVVLEDSYNKINDKTVSQLRKLMLEKLAPKYPYVSDLVKYKKPLHDSVGRNRTKLKKKKTKTTIKHNNTIIEEQSAKNK